MKSKTIMKGKKNKKRKKKKDKKENKDHNRNKKKKKTEEKKKKKQQKRKNNIEQAARQAEASQPIRQSQTAHSQNAYPQANRIRQASSARVLQFKPLPQGE